MNSRRFLNIAALAAVFLAASPPTNACTMTRTGLPDDHVAQYTEQIDKNVNMVAVRNSSGNLVIPMVNRLAEENLAAGEHFAQTMVFDDHPRFANIDHLCMYPVNKDLNVVTATRGLYLGNSHYYLNANGANATSFNPQVNCLQNNGPAELSARIKVPQPANTAWAWRPSWR